MIRKIKMNVKKEVTGIGVAVIASFTTVITGWAEVWTYDVPGGEALSSADYEVSVTQNGETKSSFVYQSKGFATYPRLRENGSLDQMVTIPHKGPAKHSHSIFSFDGTVTVRVKIRPGAEHITLPLKSAKVLPSSYDIPCWIENGNTIVFTLDRPEKVAILPNYEQTWNKFVNMGKGHVPIQTWDVDYGVESKRKDYHGRELSSALEEGYANPLILSALPPETRVPNPKKQKTLFVNPGDRLNEDEMLAYDVVWFRPGIHDHSQMGYAPFFQTRIKRGQTVYIEGGAYVLARFKRYHDKEAGPTAIIGRGVISGAKHLWIHSFSEASQLIDIDIVSGITLTDRAGFSIYSSRLIEDVTLVGAWHGNCDGPDYSDNSVIRNCFFMSHDDNLKINHNTKANHIVLWQATNAHALMVKETYRSDTLMADSVVEDVDIITYFKDPNVARGDWPRQGMGAIACVTAVPYTIQNFIFRDIRIESPYLYRVFNVYNLNTGEVNPGWFMPTTDESHSKIDGMHFENITVTSPLIAYRSQLGSGHENAIKNITFKNIVINGTGVTEENKEQFFDIQEERIDGLSFSCER